MHSILTHLKTIGLMCQQMDLVLKVQSKLAGEQKQIWAIAIKQGIENKVDNSVIIDTLKSQIEDNYNMVADVLGIKLIDKILNFKL
jgi:hypothetical protein